MVRKALFPVYVRPQYFIFEPGRHYLVVDAPSDIVVPCSAAIRPPRVLVLLLLESAKRIGISVLAKNLVEPRAFLGQATRVFLVLFPVPDIRFFVHDIPVATDDVL